MLEYVGNEGYTVVNFPVSDISFIINYINITGMKVHSAFDFETFYTDFRKGRALDARCCSSWLETNKHHVAIINKLLEEQHGPGKA